MAGRASEVEVLCGLVLRWLLCARARGLNVRGLETGEVLALMFAPVMTK